MDRAHDPRLKRDIATGDSTAQCKERFEREAQAIAALNHSNICQLNKRDSTRTDELTPANDKALD